MTGLKDHKLLVRDSASEIEQDYLKLREEGWQLDPAFVDPDSFKDVLQKLYERKDGTPKAAIKTKITMGLVRYREPEPEEAKAIAERKEKAAKIAGTGEQKAMLIDRIADLLQDLKKVI